MTNVTPTERVEPCRACLGMGGFSRGEAFDACDLCGGSGEVTRRYCTVARLDGEACGERVMLVVYRSDSTTTVWGCINGHRWTVHRVAGAVEWSRTEDRVAEVVAP